MGRLLGGLGLVCEALSGLSSSVRAQAEPSAGGVPPASLGPAGRDRGCSRQRPRSLFPAGPEGCPWAGLWLPRGSEVPSALGPGLSCAFNQPLPPEDPPSPQDPSAVNENVLKQKWAAPL